MACGKHDADYDVGEIMTVSMTGKTSDFYDQLRSRGVYFATQALDLPLGN